MVAVFILGICIGVIGMRIIRGVKSAGTLIIIDPESGSESPYLFIEVEKPKELKNGNHILVRVKRRTEPTPR